MIVVVDDDDDDDDDDDCLFVFCLCVLFVSLTFAALSLLVSLILG